MLDQAQSAISSYLEWWHDAGYASPVAEQPVNWLQVQHAPAQPTAPTRDENVAGHNTIVPDAMTSRSGAGRKATSPLAQAPTGAPALNPADKPTRDTLDAWLSRIFEEAGLGAGETAWRAYGPADAELLILADMPDRDVAGSPSCLSPAGHQLMTAMLKTGGMDITQRVRIAPLSPARPAGGQLDNSIHSILAEIARRHISAVSPKHLLIAGQQTLAILATIAIPIDGVVKPNVNHDVANMASFAIHHPRLLLERPMLKRQAWQAIKRMRELG
jgi:DNA polymerase